MNGIKTREKKNLQIIISLHKFKTKSSTDEIKINVLLWYQKYSASTRSMLVKKSI